MMKPKPIVASLVGMPLAESFGLPAIITQQTIPITSSTN